MKKNSKELEENARKMFDLLRQHRNEQVNVIYFRYGNLEVRTGYIEELHDFICIAVNGLSLPFIGYELAIARITTNNGELLYSNPEYSVELSTTEQINEAKRNLFGADIVNEEIQKREEALKKYNEENNPLKVQRSRLTLQKEGIPYIKPGLVGEWLEFVEKNGIGTDARVINAIIEILKELYAETSYEEIEELLTSFALEDYQQLAVVNYVAHFSNLGEDFKNYWNTIHPSDEIELNRRKR